MLKKTKKVLKEQKVKSTTIGPIPTPVNDAVELGKAIIEDVKDALNGDLDKTKKKGCGE